METQFLGSVVEDFASDGQILRYQDHIAQRDGIKIFTASGINVLPGMQRIYCEEKEISF
jgi:hypothetical protein